ncbi:MAG: hypothetical protein IKQ46_18445 [Bacteroidales bacterium]|nr:hypothetical protein [Bacteroidales bacterium]
MHKINLIYLVLLVLFVGNIGCSDGDYNFSDVSTDDAVLQTAVQGPVTQTNITFKDLFEIDGVGGILKTDKGTYTINEHSLQAITFPLTLHTGSKIHMDKMIEDLDVSKIFGKDGWCETLDKMTFKFYITNTLPFEGTVSVSPAVNVEGVGTKLPDSNFDKHSFFVNKGENHVFHELTFDNSDTQLLSASNALYVTFEITLPEDGLTVNADDYISFDMSVFFGGRFLVDNF